MKYSSHRLSARTRLAMRVMTATMLVMGLQACGGGGEVEVREWMEQVRKEMRPGVAKLSEPKVYVPVSYTGKSEIDPFNPSKLLVALARARAESNNGLKPDMERRREALEAFPLDTIKMVGTLEKHGVKQALLQVDRTVYRAKAGNYVGQNFGLITQVNETEVQIKEIVLDAAGEWVERQSKLELQEAKK